MLSLPGTFACALRPSAWPLALVVVWRTCDVPYRQGSLYELTIFTAASRECHAPPSVSCDQEGVHHASPAVSSVAESHVQLALGFGTATAHRLGHGKLMSLIKLVVVVHMITPMYTHSQACSDTDHWSQVENLDDSVLCYSCLQRLLESSPLE